MLKSCKSQYQHVYHIRFGGPSRFPYGRDSYHSQPDSYTNQTHKPQEEVVPEDGRVAARQTLAASIASHSVPCWTGLEKGQRVYTHKRELLYWR